MKPIGIFTTMITPYRADGSVDYETARRYVRWYCEKGLNGIFAVCQSSEIFYLTVEERVRLNGLVWEEVQNWNRTHERKVTVVSSGHVADDLDAQAAELNAIAKSGTDALIWITNRLAKEDESDDVWIANAEKLLQKMPADVKLGLYECPYPYKRLVNEKILNWCLSTGRFAYMKDTCCDAAEIARRVRQLAGSGFQLLNANCQTLLQSLKDGADGYCGIMANFHPELYVWLCENFAADPQKAELIQSLLGTVGFTEGGLPYPLSAKYHMCLEGIPTENYARNRKAGDLTDYMKESTAQLRTLCRYFIENVLK